MCHNVHMKTISIRELHLETGRWVRHAASRERLRYSRQTRDLSPDEIRRFLVLQFLEDGWRNQNAIEELRKEIRLMNEDQVVQWR